MTALAPDPGSAAAFDLGNVIGVSLVLDRGTADATTDVDGLRAISDAEASAMDTLMVLHTFGSNPTPAPTMTVYHGHDLPRPFIVTGFAPWQFQRAQCWKLFDFVLREMWGLPRAASTAEAVGRGPARSMATRGHVRPAATLPQRGVRRHR